MWADKDAEKICYFQWKVIFHIIIGYETDYQSYPMIFLSIQKRY
jgi:hypothetical protein